MNRGLVAAALLGLTGLGAAIACGGSQYGIDSSDAGSAEGGALDASDDAQSVDAATNDASAPDTSAPVVDDAGAKIDASGCLPGNCDCDGDGFVDTTKAGCISADAAPPDCDDKDSRTRPSQGYLIDPPEPPRNGDWNCAGGVEKFYRPNVACTALQGGPACDGTFGFEDDPGCGATGTFVTCKTGGLLNTSCVVNAKSQTKQACK